jgi:signal transduction histidine kinase
MLGKRDAEVNQYGVSAVALSLLWGLSVVTSVDLTVLTDLICCVIFFGVFMLLTRARRYNPDQVSLHRYASVLGLLLAFFFFLHAFSILQQNWPVERSSVMSALLAVTLGYAVVILVAVCGAYKRWRRLLWGGACFFLLHGYLLYSGIVTAEAYLLQSLLVAFAGGVLSLVLSSARRSLFSTGVLRYLRPAYICFLGYLLFSSLSLRQSFWHYPAGMMQLLTAGLIYRSVFFQGVITPYLQICHELSEVRQELSAKTVELDGNKTALQVAMRIFYHLEQLRVMGELTASISHEVKNSVTSVRGYLQIFLLEDDFRNYRTALEMMLQDIDRATHILQEHLRLGKDAFASGKALKDVRTLIANQSILLQSTAERNGKKLILDLHPVSDIMANEGSLLQVFVNLAFNALEAMEPGGTLTISTYPEDNWVVIAFQDEGCGIPPELLNKIQEPFVTTKEKGSGMGLPFCYRVARWHNGTIQVRTGEEGTCFSVRLPAADA